MKLFNFLATGAGLFLVIPAVALAHERWFLNASKNTLLQAPKPEVFTQWSNFNVAVVLGVLALFLIGLSLHFLFQKHPSVKASKKFLGRFAGYIPMLLRNFMGALLIIAALNGKFFAPDLPLWGPGEARPIWTSLELLLGLGFLTGLYPRLFAGAGILYYAAGFLLFDPLDLLQYFIFAGIFVYFLIGSDPTLPKVKTEISFRDMKWVGWLQEKKPYALSLLRMSFGFALILAALFNKLWFPQFGLAFLETHSLNFLADTAWAITNAQYVFLCGMAEILVGIFIFFGILPRLCGGLLIVMFTITMTVLGWAELIGHLPMYAAAYALLTAGGGEKWSLE